MKKFTFLTLILLSSIIAFSQERSIINVGAGYPFFSPQNFDENSGGSHHIGNDRLHAFIELPQLIKFRKNPDFSLTPGFGYFHFNEDETSGALGGGSSTVLKHSSLSLYVKLNYSITKNDEKPFCWYAGLLGGFYIYSNSKGEMFWWSYMQGGAQSGTQEIDKSGKSFYNNFYNGIYAGFKIKTDKIGFFRPAFEFSFFPGFANITDNFRSIQNKDESLAKSMVMISLNLGFGHKKSHSN